MHEEIVTFDEIHAHLVGEERMLEIGAVVDAWRKQRDGRLGIADCSARHFQGSAEARQGNSQSADAIATNSSGNRCIIVSRFSSM